MKQVFLDDKEINDDLFPFTLTRSAADIRIGILTIREKWSRYLGTEPLSSENEQPIPGNAAVIPANVIPSQQFVSSGGSSLAAAKVIQYPWHIFMLNEWALIEDFKLITAGRHSRPIPDTVNVTNPANIFIEEGARLSHCIINAANGPVYIGKDAEVMEGSLLRGPLAICNNAVVKMGAKIYGATTIGPFSIVGGEIKNAVMFGYSNKAHDGYLGDSVIGEWCNLGAGTSNSNMKNNVSDVRVWNQKKKEMINTGIKKCGLIMGDYSRAAINTSFNTGTMVGVGANVFGSGDIPKFVPSFTWGKDHRYEFDKLTNDVDKWMQLKGKRLDEKEKTRLKLIFDESN